MGQWDVHANPSPSFHGEIPYLVDLQSNLLSGLATRLVAPLARTRLDFTGLPRRLCPTFAIEGGTFVLLPQEAGPVDARVLGAPVASLRTRSHDIVAALDAVVGGL